MWIIPIMVHLGITMQYIMHCFCQKHWYSGSNYINFLFVFFLRDLDSSGYVGKMDGYKEKHTSIFTQRFL